MSCPKCSYWWGNECKCPVGKTPVVASPDVAIALANLIAELGLWREVLPMNVSMAIDVANQALREAGHDGE